MSPLEEEAAPIIVSALFGTADFRWLDGLRRTHFPPERNLIDAHLTLFHHLPPSLAPELASRLRAACRRARPPATLEAPFLLGRGVAFRIRCPELETIRADLAEAFAGCLTPQDRAGWRPHVTIQNKVSPAEARVLHHALTADFAPRPLAIAGIASYFYRGGPWQPIASYRFAG